jgi:hypothetical protein
MDWTSVRGRAEADYAELIRAGEPELAADLYAE